jgi:hypothetical protein
VFQSGDEREAGLEAVAKVYYFLRSDALRELREAEVRWECFSASQYHFDDGVKFILENAGQPFPVEHPVWALYGEKLTEIEARVARAEELKLEKLAAFKAVREAMLQLCEMEGIDPEKASEFDVARPESVAKLEQTSGVPPAQKSRLEAYRLLRDAWDGAVKAAGKAS